jgi:hypothetical protein
MRKDYLEPELEIRKYRITPDVFTDSDPGLHDGDEYDLDSVGDPEGLDDVFAK